MFWETFHEKNTSWENATRGYLNLLVPFLKKRPLFPIQGMQCRSCSTSSLAMVGGTWGQEGNNSLWMQGTQRGWGCMELLFQLNALSSTCRPAAAAVLLCLSCWKWLGGSGSSWHGCSSGRLPWLPAAHAPSPPLWAILSPTPSSTCQHVQPRVMHCYVVWSCWK